MSHLMVYFVYINSELLNISVELFCFGILIDSTALILNSTFTYLNSHRTPTFGSGSNNSGLNSGTENLPVVNIGNNVIQKQVGTV